jgi:translation initiation factor IF-3
VGRRIRAREVLVIGPDGEQLGEMETRAALDKAQEFGMDLVEMNARANPPVCKILDYGKYKYEQARRARESKRNQHIVEVKEVKLRPKIGEHDFQVKLKKVLGFLEDRNKVKLVVQFRGREQVHPETGKALLDRMCQEAIDLATVISMSSMEGRMMTMMLGPKRQ